MKTTMHTTTRNPACCPACRALVAWDRAVADFRACESAGYGSAPDYAASAVASQAALAAAEFTVGAALDILAIETPFSVAYGY